MITALSNTTITPAELLEMPDVYRPSGKITRLREADELLGEDVLPGFHCRVADLFPVAAPAQG